MLVIGSGRRTDCQYFPGNDPNSRADASVCTENRRRSAIRFLLFGPWILNTLVDFTYNLLNNLYKYIG